MVCTILLSYCIKNLSSKLVEERFCAKKRRSLLGAAVGKHCGEQRWFGKRVAVSVRYIGRKMKCLASMQEIAGVRELHFDGAGADGDRLFRTFEMRIRGGSTARPDANAVGFKGARLL